MRGMSRRALVNLKTILQELNHKTQVSAYCLWLINKVTREVVVIEQGYCHLRHEELIRNLWRAVD